MKILIVDRPLIKENKENWAKVIDLYRKKGWDVFVFPYIKKEENDLLIAEYSGHTSYTQKISKLFEYRTSFGKMDEDAEYEGYYLSIEGEEKLFSFMKEVKDNIEAEFNFLTKTEKGQ